MYDAFISYSHAKDKPIAAALQSVVQNLGKPWYRRRALRVFRDDTSLSATPQLWPAIEKALADSRFLILLASPEAAASQWVGKEVSYWLEHKSLDTLLIALTDGALAWDSASGDFAWSDATPLPRPLRGRFPAEPKWIEFSEHRDQVRPRDARFRDRCADLAAAVRGVPKEDLLSEEVRQQRKALTLAWTAASSLLVLAAVAAWQWETAIRQRDRAEAALAQADRNYAIALQGGANTVEIVRRNVEDGTISTGVTQSLLEVSRETVQKLEMERSSEEISAVQWRLLNTIRIVYLEMIGQANNGVDMATRALAVSERLAAQNPRNAESLLRVITSEKGLADALAEQGNLDGALAHNRRALELVARLIAANPSEVRFKRDKGYTHQRIGDVLRRKGDFDAALAEFRAYLAEFEDLARRPDPDPDWIRGQGLARERLGDILRYKGDLDGALVEYEHFKSIAESLAPRSTILRIDLAFANQRIGDILLEKQEASRALAAYRLFHEIAADATTANPKNADWQRILANSHMKLGDALLAREQPAKALERFRSSAEIYRRLLESDARPQWQRGLAMAFGRMAIARMALGDTRGAAKDFAACLATPEHEDSVDPQLISPRHVHEDCSVRAARLARN